MKLKKINILHFKESGYNQHFHPENFDWLEYTVNKWDTLYSVLNKLWENNWIPKDLVKKALHETNTDIKPGDKITFELQDNNSAELTINNETIIINNNEESEQISELGKQFKEEIASNLETRDEKLTEIYNDLEDLLKEVELNNWALADGYYDKVLEIQQTLYSPKYKDNPEAQRAIKLVNILALPGDVSVAEAVTTISTALDDPKISFLNKQRLVKFIKENFILDLAENLWDGQYTMDYEKWVKIARKLIEKYPDKFKDFEKVINVLELRWDISIEKIINTISKVFDDEKISPLIKEKVSLFLKENYLWYLSDFEKGIEISNKLTEKYPEYDFENFMLVADPEWWEVYTNNF